MIFPLGATLCLLLTLSGGVIGGTLDGRVVEVIGGDTLVVADLDNRRHRVKLLGIAAPQIGNSAARNARRHLEMLVLGRQVRVLFVQQQPASPVLGKLTHGGADMNLRMLQAGLSRFQPHPLLGEKDRIHYEQAQQRARGAGLGIWRRPALRY